MQTTTSEIDWKGLTKDIINNKCVLVLGPEFCKTADKSFTKQLSNHLVESILKQKNIQPQEKDWLEKEKHNLFYTSQKYEMYSDYSNCNVKTNLIDKAESFHANNIEYHKKVNSLYQEITKIPFHIIINLAPDLLLQKAFIGRRHSFGYYNFYDNASDVLHNNQINVKNSGHNPLIYNLFGVLGDNNMRKDIGYSAVLTENSLFQFLKQTFSSAENRLPPQLLSKLQRKKFLFLGFNFNDWYFRPLIDLLNLRKRNLNVIASKSSQTIAVSNHIVYSDFYKFHFTNFEVEDFINKLVEEFPQDVKKATLVYHENDEDTLNEFCSYWGKKAQYIKFVRIRDNEYPTIQIENQQPIIFWCTQDLLNTSFSENKDALPAIVEQCKQECICLIPIVVKSCMYQDIFDEIFSLCKANQKPIYSYQDQATVYTGIAIELNEIIFPKNK